MAAVTRLTPGTRVRLKHDYQTRLGNLVREGTEGVVGKQPPLKPHIGTAEGTMIWINVKSKAARGWWLPARSLVRLREPAS